MKTSDNEWQRVVQLVTTSGTTNDNEWYNEWQRVTTNDNEWQECLFWLIFQFSNKSIIPMDPKEYSLNTEENLEERLLK